MKTTNFLTGFFLVLFLAGSYSTQAATKTWTGGTGDWFVDANWGAGPMPVAGDDVVIATVDASVFLTNSTPPLSSLTLSNTLVFSNWDTKLSATNVTILTNGVMTLPGAYTNNVMSNNVYVICSNLTINAGGKIDVDGRGYDGGTNNGGNYGAGNGPGFGSRTTGTWGGGAGHGGWALANWAQGGPAGFPYDSPTNPLTPGSGGSSGYPGTAGNHNGGAGGGAVRVEATGTATINGTITANGMDGGSVYVTGGGGSGGSILIRCRTLEGSNGVIRANGGSTGSGGQSGQGAGGRIAIYYDVNAERALGTFPTLGFTALPGTTGQAADIGSLFFPDTYFLQPVIGTNLAGQIWGVTAWSPSSLIVSNTWIRFAEDGFQLFITNQMIVNGSAAKFELGGGQTLTNRDTYRINCFTSGPTMNVGQDLILTNGGTFIVYAGMTNAAATNYGALVSVTGKVQVGASSWIYPNSHFTNGGSVRFRMQSLEVAANAGFNADYRGFAGGSGRGQNGYGPGKGTAVSGDFSGGGGYGGRGGRSQNPSAFGGTTYGSAATPIDPGSGGASGEVSRHGGSGGGVVWLDVTDTIALAGAITARGETSPDAVAGAGAGGSIYLKCKSISGTGVFSTAGGIGGAVLSDGGGGGGRIAIAYDPPTQGALPLPTFTFTCAGNVGYEYGDLGTLWLPDNRFLAETLPHSAQWIVPGFTSWSPNRLCISNGWIRFPFDAFVLTVTNDVTVIGTNANLNKLEVSKLTCATIEVTNAALIVKGNSAAPSLTCAGSITLRTNGVLTIDAGSTTGFTMTCSGNLVLNSGASFYAYAGATSGVATAQGGFITVAGDLQIASNAFVYPYSQLTNGGSTYFSVRNVTVSKGAKIDADAKGFSGGIGLGAGGSSGYGPGKGPGYNGDWSDGAGHGGRGGGSVNHPSAGGTTYGSSNFPTIAGSGGGFGYGSYGVSGGRGGGLVRLDAANTITLDGAITANGESPSSGTRGGGAGGGIYLRCRRIIGNNGVLNASGGNAGNTSYDGGGGGGRIAVWRVSGDPNQFVCSVSNGIGYTNATVNYSAPGTIVWGQLPIPGAIISVY